MGVPSVGDLVAFAVAGFVTIMAIPHARYWCNRQDGYKMFFSVIAVGCIAIPLARLVGDVFVSTGIRLPVAAHPLVYDLSWVAATDACLFASLSWRPLARRAAKWVSRISGDLIEHVLQEGMDRGFFVELTMENGKSYIGFPVESGVATSDDSDISVIPILSGYRNDKTRELQITTSYRHALDRVRQGLVDLQPSDFQVIVPKGRIMSAKRFDPLVYIESLQRRGSRNNGSADLLTHALPAIE